MTPHPREELTFNALRSANTARLPEFRNGKGEIAHASSDGSDWSLNDWLTAVCGELGEAANVLKKVRRGDFTLEEASSKLKQEFADVVIYLDLLAKQAGINLGEAVTETFNAKSVQVGSRVRLPVSASAAPSQEPMSACPECGPDVRVDEDGCCIGCGADCNSNAYLRRVEADSRAADLHRRLNQGVSDALGQPFGATWHDLPEKVVALTQQLSTLQQQIDEMVSVLKPACDRTWEHETPIQVAHIAANAIHWRDAEIQQLQQQIDERDRRIAQLTAVAHEAAIGYAKQSARAEAAEQQIDTLTQDNETLRRMLWLNHGCPTDALYGDDGEMQCPCPVDFKREAPEVIEQRWRDRNLAAYRRHHQEEPGS